MGPQTPPNLDQTMIVPLHSVYDTIVSNNFIQRLADFVPFVDFHRCVSGNPMLWIHNRIDRFQF